MSPLSESQSLLDLKEMAPSKFLVLLNILLMAILVFALQVAARELIGQSFRRKNNLLFCYLFFLYQLIGERGQGEKALFFINKTRIRTPHLLYLFRYRCMHEEAMHERV